MSRRVELGVVLGLLLIGLAARYAMTAHWTYAGSDSYGYIHLSDELRHHGRLALAPNQPLQWARLPLYPIFLTLKGDAPTAMDWHGDAAKGSGWLRITRAQAWVDLLVMAMLVWAMVRRLAGPRAALGALGFAVLSPFTTPFVGAVLTETLAIALSTASLAPLILWNDKPRRAFAASGALIGLGMLLRADALLLATGLAPALWFLCPSWKERLRAGALALVCAALVFAPWPARNLARFGQAHPIGARIDRDSQPLENVDGYWHWLRTVARTWQVTTSPWTCYYDRTSQCPSIVPDLERLDAFDSPEEKARVELLLSRRAKDGLTPAVDAAFAELAAERSARRPILVYAILPLLRAGNMWVTWYTETMTGPFWQPVRSFLWETMFPLTLLQLLLIVGAGLFLLGRRETRAVAAILLTAMLVRTMALAWTAYSMPRYALEMMPLGWVLIAAAAPSAIAMARAELRRRFPRQPAK